MLVWAAAAAANVASAGGSSVLDATAYVQKDVRRYTGSQDMYVSTAETLEDVMFWAVMCKSMERQLPQYPHTLLLRGGGPLAKNAGAIRTALGQNRWHATVEVFSPTEDLKPQSAGKENWRQLAPFRYSQDEYRRIVHISPESLVFKNIDDMTHRDPHLIFAREQGDCGNLTETLDSTLPALNLYSMVPDKGIASMMVPASVLLASADSSVKANVTHASLLARAFERVHPGMEQGLFGVTEVTSADCLLHHKEAELHDHSMIDNMRVMHWGREGKKLVVEIIRRGERRLVNTLSSLDGHGKVFLANAVRTWFELFASDEVRNVINAAEVRNFVNVAKAGKVANITTDQVRNAVNAAEAGKVANITTDQVRNVVSAAEAGRAANITQG